MLEELLTSESRPTTALRTDSMSLRPEQLRPGQAFARYTEPARGGRVDILDVPCCGRTARVMAPESSSGDVYLLLCVPCRKAYKAELTGDIDGGWDAVLTLETIEFTTTRSRRQGK